MEVRTTTVTRYSSYAEMPDSMQDDALLRIEADPAVLHGAWAVPGGCAYAFASVDAYGGEPCWLNVVGSAPADALLLAETALGELGGKCRGITVPRSLPTDGLTWRREEAGLWDLMRCDAAPPVQPGESQVTQIHDLAAVQAFLDRVNPHHSVAAAHHEVEAWLGVADSASGLLAVGAFTRRVSGTAYLASIATAPEARGRGLGAAVAAALTRRAFAQGDALCTLAHYHPNEPARRIYLRLGYRTTHQLSSHHLDSAEETEITPAPEAG
jgi:ribosomal protein S18 acetylase RimI-like enzyme